MVTENVRKMFDIPLQIVNQFSIPLPNLSVPIEELPNVLTTPQQLKNRKKEPAHCIQAKTPPLGISEVGVEGRPLALDFSSLLLPFSFSCVEAMFLELSTAYLPLIYESPGWQ